MNTRKLTAGVVTNLATLTPFALNSLNKNKKNTCKIEKIEKMQNRFDDSGARSNVISTS